MESGSFALVRRGDEWDEVLLAAKLLETEWVAYTTATDADRFVWTAIQPTPNCLLPVTGRGANRRAPRGIDEATINWMINPDDPYLAEKWAPKAAQLSTLMAEGTTVAKALADEGSTMGFAAHVAGAGGIALPEMPLGYGQGLPPQIGIPVRGPVLPETVPPEPPREDMDSLIKAVSELQLAVATAPKGKQDKKDKKDKKKKGSDTEDVTPKKKKKRKKKPRGRRKRSS